MTTTAPSRTLIPTGTWVVDPSHSRVEFQVKHLGIASVRGDFEAFEGVLEIGEDPSSSKAYGTVEPASVNTNDEKRDEHLRSADFFDSEQHGRIDFASTSIVPVGDDRFEIKGDLTIRGITREVRLVAEVTGTERDPWGNERVGLEVTGEIDRGDYGISFNQVLGSGNVLVSEKVKLHLDVSAVKQA
ncbi:MAG TPA: YceI family protein [Thermoleophilaceae bacterium]|nr:YceI family protein [Thermoleophilaceae bacterium]